MFRLPFLEGRARPTPHTSPPRKSRGPSAQQPPRTRPTFASAHLKWVVPALISALSVLIAFYAYTLQRTLAAYAEYQLAVAPILDQQKLDALNPQLFHFQQQATNFKFLNTTAFPIYVSGVEFQAYERVNSSLRYTLGSSTDVPLREGALGLLLGQLRDSCRIRVTVAAGLEAKHFTYDCKTEFVLPQNALLEETSTYDGELAPTVCRSMPEYRDIDIGMQLLTTPSQDDSRDDNRMPNNISLGCG